jgi:hypothetical protein
MSAYRAWRKAPGWSSGPQRPSGILHFATLNLAGSYPHHFVEAQSHMRLLHVGKQHPPHPIVALVEDLIGPLLRHLTHQNHGKGLERCGEVRAATFPRQCDTEGLAAVATAPSW